MDSSKMPPKVRAVREKLLDVRPLGGDPSRLIVRTAGELAPEEALHLTAGFDPAPLYAMLRNQGIASHTQAEGGLFHVWFWRESRRAHPAVAPFEERSGLKEPVELDVRDLQQPLIAILEKLAALGDGAQLLVRHRGEPALLDEKLAERGYAAHTSRRGAGDGLAHIAPAWAFGDEAA